VENPPLDKHPRMSKRGRSCDTECLATPQRD